MVDTLERYTKIPQNGAYSLLWYKDAFEADWNIEIHSGVISCLTGRPSTTGYSCKPSVGNSVTGRSQHETELWFFPPHVHCMQGPSKLHVVPTGSHNGLRVTLQWTQTKFTCLWHTFIVNKNEMTTTWNIRPEWLLAVWRLELVSMDGNGPNCLWLLQMHRSWML